MGQSISGVIRAYDEYEAVSKLRETCAFITKLEEVPEKESVLLPPNGRSHPGQGAGADVLPVFHHSLLRPAGGAVREDGGCPEQE